MSYPFYIVGSLQHPEDPARLFEHLLDALSANPNAGEQYDLRIERSLPGHRIETLYQSTESPNADAVLSIPAFRSILEHHAGDDLIINGSWEALGRFGYDFDTMGYFPESAQVYLEISGDIVFREGTRAKLPDVRLVYDAGDVRTLSSRLGSNPNVPSVVAEAAMLTSLPVSSLHGLNLDVSADLTTTSLCYHRVAEGFGNDLQNIYHLPSPPLISHEHLLTVLGELDDVELAPAGQGYLVHHAWLTGGELKGFYQKLFEQTTIG